MFVINGANYISKRVCEYIHVSVGRGVRSIYYTTYNIFAFWLETILLHAFDYMPESRIPDLDSSPEERIYELRSYESYTEHILANKIQMFNEGGEVSLFEKLEFNAVFYAEVISGSHMPNLMYMTSFANMESREEHWAAFRDHPDWTRIKSMEEYQNNVSHIDRIMLHHTAYSDF